MCPRQPTELPQRRSIAMASRTRSARSVVTADREMVGSDRASRLSQIAAGARGCLLLYCRWCFENTGGRQDRQHDDDDRHYTTGPNCCCLGFRCHGETLHVEAPHCLRGLNSMPVQSFARLNSDGSSAEKLTTKQSIGGARVFRHAVTVAEPK